MRVLGWWRRWWRKRRRPLRRRGRAVATIRPVDVDRERVGVRIVRQPPPSRPRRRRGREHPVPHKRRTGRWE